MKKLISFILPIIIAILMVNVVSNDLDKKIAQLKDEKDISVIGKNYGDYVKDKSSKIKEMLSDSGNLFLLGSSELGIQVPENPLNLFPISGENYNISGFGRAYSQDLQQATYLGGSNIEENQKVAFVVSIQWFESQNGVKPNNFAVNFSDIQFYKFLNNPKISDKNKEYYARRTYSLLSQAKKYPAEALYARLYCSKNPFKNYIGLIFKPYYFIKQYLLNIKDKALIYKELKALPNKKDKPIAKNANWNNDNEEIKKDSSKHTFNNEFHLEDNYYKAHINELAKTKDESKDENPIESEEFDDYNFFLSVCKDLNIKPYIIMLPVNGWYYDYLGLPKDKRYEYYDKVKSIANENQLDVLDLKDHEYDQGYLIDTVHFGRKGWLEVSEAIYKHFNQK